MTQQYDLPGGGTVTIDIDTDDPVVRRMLNSQIEIGVEAIENAEEARKGARS